MDGLNKLGAFLSTAVKVLFGILMAGILFATLGIDRNNANQFPNTVMYDNGIYYLAAFLLLAGLYWLVYMRFSKRPGRAALSPRTYWIALGTMALVVAVLQVIISRWMPYPGDYFNSDFKQIMDGAWDLSKGGSLENYSYFRRSPNNLNITIALSWLYRVFPYKRVPIVVGALLTNATVVVASLTVRNVTRRDGLALAVAGVGELLAALTWRAFLPYTDNYSMLFVALMLWLYTSKLKPELKIPLITLCAAVACFLKITSIILYVALTVNGLIRWLCAGERKLNLKRMGLYALCAVILFGTVFGIQGPLRKQAGFRVGHHPKGWQYLFMVGQNTQSLGNVDPSNRKVRDAFIDQYPDNRDTNNAFLRKAFEYISERGLWGNLSFYVNKLNVGYNDGYFHNVQTKGMAKMEPSMLYNLYIQGGKYYQVGATLFQILWDGVLLTMMAWSLCEAVAWRRWRKAGKPKPTPKDADTDSLTSQLEDSLVRCLRITIMAVTLYLLCLEGRSKYLYMFMPVFLTAFGVMFDSFGNLTIAATVRE